MAIEEPLSVRVRPEYVSMIERSLRRGDYESLSDCLRAAVRELFRRPVEPRTLRRLEGLAESLGVSPDEALSRLLARYGGELGRRAAR